MACRFKDDDAPPASDVSEKLQTAPVLFRLQRHCRFGQQFAVLGDVEEVTMWLRPSFDCLYGLSFTHLGSLPTFSLRSWAAGMRARQSR